MLPTTASGGIWKMLRQGRVGSPRPHVPSSNGVTLRTTTSLSKGHSRSSGATYAFLFLGLFSSFAPLQMLCHPHWQCPDLHFRTSIYYLQYYLVPLEQRYVRSPSTGRQSENQGWH